MPNIADVMESYLQGKLQVDNWRKEFEAQYYKPVMDALIGMAIEGARKSPEVDQNKLMKNLSPAAQKKFRGE
jgi:hypothetical protein